MALTLLVIGFLSLLMQTILIRKLLSVFSGNELHIGITLSLWLLFTSIGSRLSLRFKRDILGYLFIIASFVYPLTFILISFIRPLSMIHTGETVPFTKTLLWTLFAIAPSAAISGAMFSASLFRWKRGPLLFALESLGAFIGGIVFVFLISGHLNSLIVLHLAGVLSLVTGLLLMNKRWPIILLMLLPLFYLIGIWSQEFQWSPLRLIKNKESRYQEIAILSKDNHFYLYTGGRFFYSYPDILRDERDVHVIMNLHEKPEDILLIGGNIFSLREFLKYPVERLDIVEIDPVMINLSADLLDKNDRELIGDRRLNIITEDPRFYIKRIHNRYDMIILYTSEPLTALTSRFYTLEFFKDLKLLLDEGGLLILRVPQSSGYISTHLQRLNGSIYNTLKEVFPFTMASSEEYGILIAGKSQFEIEPSMLRERFNSRMINVLYFEPSLFFDIFSSFKIDRVTNRLTKVKDINSDKKPAVYLYNLLFWAYSESGLLRKILDISTGGAIAIILFILITAFLILKRPIPYMIYTTGYVTISFSIVIILFYQIFYESIYERVGLLTSLFMFGLAAGSWLGSERRPWMGIMRASELCFVVILLSSIYLLRYEPFFYIMSVFAGFLGGLQFSLSSNMLSNKGQGNIATVRLYAIDLAGSFGGAIVTTLYMIPHLGMSNSLVILGLVKILSFVLLLFYEKT